MQKSSVSISLILRTKVSIQQEATFKSLAPTQTNKNLATNAIKGLSIPSRPLAKVRSDRDNKINIFGIFVVQIESEDCKINSKLELQIGNLYDVKQTLGPQVSLVASLKIAYITVGEQITVEQLIEKRIIMTLSRHDHVYRHHIQNKQTDSCLHLLLLLHTSTAIQHASRVLSS